MKLNQVVNHSVKGGNYLKDGDKAYTTGAYIIWDAKKECWRLDEVDGEIMFDGAEVQFDEDWKPYTE